MPVVAHPDEGLPPLLQLDADMPRPGVDLGSLAREKDLITAEEHALWSRKEALRKNVIKVDDFPKDFGRAELVAAQAEDTVKMKAA